MDITGYIGLSSARTRVILSELMDDGKVQVEGNGRSRRAAKLAQKDGCKTQVSIEKRKQMWYAIRAALYAF